MLNRCANQHKQHINNNDNDRGDNDEMVGLWMDTKKVQKIWTIRVKQIKKAEVGDDEKKAKKPLPFPQKKFLW